MPRSLISVIIPVYNHAKELRQSLPSVLNQTYQETEVLVVDDGSDRSEIDFIKSELLWKYPQVNFFFTEHKGAPAARNRGFRESHGQYVIFWDADVTANPTLLSKMAGILEERSQISFVYSSFKYGWKIFKCGPFDAERLKKNNYITTTSLLRREHFPGWDESLEKFQDWDLWLTMSERGRQGHWLDEILFVVKPRRGGLSSWLPSFVYKFPWLPLPALKRYCRWKEIVLKKHCLCSA